MHLLFWVIIVLLALRLGMRLRRRFAASRPLKPVKPLHLNAWQKKLYTVLIFTKLNTRRFFRDRLALFFGILFPLIFLFVFGALTRGSGDLSFHVAVINQSHQSFAQQYVQKLQHSPEFKINKSITSFSDAKNRMTRNQLDGTIVLPASFGTVSNGVPSGQAQVYYTANNEQSGQTLATVLQATLQPINSKFVTQQQPLVVQKNELRNKSLKPFDYTFSGLLGFSIIGIGIFGPINVFPELKKQGILRRLHTTPIRVWQYFLSTMFSQAITGITSIAIQFVVAISVFHLKVVGNYLEIILFTILSIFMILGIGLAIGGWAKNERQAAPLSNIIVFPMLFLSGTFFPRYAMPEWLQHITNYLPLTPVIDGLRLLITEGKHLTDIGPQLGYIVVWLVIIYIISFRVFRWE